ncbi:PHD finger protein 20-like protein 1 isoform X1 [Megalops cyprinoides]|uniref:PHD finger protein 20-like protein 1 isoform X1 n=1 Tax=Megalops cyprinoides TaxID=118141 RepID=UPI0018644877|nr:PHD finger protein 20-like protein 1 isoform X1 [Megalops cyprinoides]
MSKKPPNRPGITFEVGARVEAQDYLQKWYPSRIEKIDYDEGKMLVHFDRWSHRYDEWIFWDSNRLRPLERPALRKEGLKDEDEMAERLGEMRSSRFREPPGCTESTEDQTELPQSRQDLKDGEEVLARWTDCRYYPAKIETVNKEGTYTVQFYDGVIRCVKRMHIKSMPEDAKGQDWIALVKAATAAAKSKGACRPRTSANSNKDKEARRAGASDDEADEDTEAEEESGAVESFIEDEKKPSPEQLEMAKTKRKKSTKPGSSFSAKKARLSKNTELVSKATNEDEGNCKEEQPDPPATSDEGPLVGSEEQGTPYDPIQTPSAQRRAPSFAGSHSRLGNRRPKPDQGESHSSQKQPRPCSSVPPVGGVTLLATESTAAPVPMPSSPDITQTALAVTAPPSSPRTSEQNHRRRRSQRLATFTPESLLDPACTSPLPSEGKSPYSNPAASEVQHVVEKCESPPHHLSACIPPASPLPLPQPPIAERGKQTDTASSNQMGAGEKSPPLAAAAGVKIPARTPKPNKHAREPIINTKRTDDPTSPKEPLFDLDHNKFKCQIPGCSKAFRKAKLLDYHLKYYHSADKEVESEMWSPDRAGRTRATSASVPSSTLLETPDSKRRRTVSTSSSLSPPGHVMSLDCSGGCSKPPKFGKKKRSSASVCSEGTEIPLPLPLQSRDRSFESLHDKILKKVIEKDPHLEPGLIKTEKKIKLEDKCQLMGKKKDKDKERKDKKEKDPFKIKQKKKKKKKKKSKQHSYSDLEDMSLAFLERCSSSSPYTLHGGSSSSKHNTFQYPRAILSVDLTGENLSDIDFLEDSTTESLLLSGEEYGQDLDSLTMDDFQEEDDDTNEIVRCICEMDEENGFMIQCEECMCWQHSVCMGLLEDSIPDQYICYICRDPPRQRWSAKYRHDKDWLNKGHMYGLSFLSENYSHQNAKKIVSTHQLLADVYSVKKVLHGLQLKMEILQNKHNPDLHLWARSWVNSDEDQPMGGVPDCIHFQEHLADPLNQNSNPEAYIASEHSYQKPPGLGLDPWSVADLLSSDGEDGVRLEEGPEIVAETTPHTALVPKEEEEGTAITIGCLSESRPDSAEQAKNCLQWQLNLLTHIEDIQNQVASRMDLIEKELDVLESWLDFTGELEPPDPLARLPQLKHRIKQLLTDLGKVQQMSSLCSV